MTSMWKRGPAGRVGINLMNTEKCQARQKIILILSLRTEIINNINLKSQQAALDFEINNSIGASPHVSLKKAARRALKHSSEEIFLNLRSDHENSCSISTVFAEVRKGGTGIPVGLNSHGRRTLTWLSRY